MQKVICFKKDWPMFVPTKQKMKTNEEIVEELKALKNKIEIRRNA